MAKYYGSKTQSSPRSQSASYGSFKDRNIAGMSPQKAQEALKPTPAEPVKMQKRMAGCV